MNWKIAIAATVATFALAYVDVGFAGEVDLRSELTNRNLIKESTPRAKATAATVNACTLPALLPAAPPSGAVQSSVIMEWSNTDDFIAVLWREPCPTNPALTVLYLAVVPGYASVPFICSAGFNAIVDGVQYDIKLIRTTDGPSFCDDLYVTTTFVVSQWSFDPPFDQNRPLSLIYDGVYGDYVIGLPAWASGPGSVVRFPAQVPVTKWPAAHGVYAAIVAGDWAEAKRRYDANPTAVADAMGAIAYWFQQFQP